MNTYLMILIFLIFITPLIYGAYKLKMYPMLLSMIRPKILNVKEKPKKEYEDHNKQFEKNRKKMKEIEEHEDEYIPERQKFRAAILNVKDELENK